MSNNTDKALVDLSLEDAAKEYEDSFHISNGTEAEDFKTGANWQKEKDKVIVDKLKEEQGLSEIHIEHLANRVISCEQALEDTNQQNELIISLNDKLAEALRELLNEYRLKINIGNEGLINRSKELLKSLEQK